MEGVPSAPTQGRWDKRVCNASLLCRTTAGPSNDCTVSDGGLWDYCGLLFRGSGERVSVDKSHPVQH